MNSLSKVFPTFFKALTWAKKEVGVTWQTIWGGDPFHNAVTQANLMQNDKNWVYVCVDKIADAVSSVPFKLMEYDTDGKDNEVIDHPAIDLINKPNSQMTGKDFKYVTVAHMELTGNAYWLKDTNGEPTQLFTLIPRNVTPKISADRMSIESYKYRQDVSEIPYAPDRIIHLKYPNPMSPLIGRGTLEPIAEWVDVDNYATEFNRRFFLNSANFGGAIESEASTDEAVAKLRLSLDNNYKGLMNAHKLIVLPKGVKLNDAGRSPRDMQMQQADSTFRDKILAAFGVPKSVVGIVEDVNRANAESSNYVFMAFTVKPKLERLITYLNEFYLPLFKGTEKMYFTFDNPIPENQQIQMDENKASLAGAPWETVNEVRAKKGLAPVAGGDTLQNLFNLTPLGEIADTSPVPSANAMRAKSLDKQGRAVDKVTGKIFDFINKKKDAAEMESMHKEFVVRVTTYEQRFEKLVSDNDKRQQKEVLSNIRNIIGVKSFKKKAVSPTDVFDKQKEINIMIDFLTPLLGSLAMDEATRAMLKVDPTMVYEVSGRLTKILEASVKRMSRSYTQTTLDLVVSKINAGIVAGSSIDQISTAVSEVYGLTDEYRANRIARTEVFSTANDANRDAYVESGVVESLKWHTAEDEDTCEFCGPMDGKTVGVNEGFFAKGDTVDGSDGGEYDLGFEKVTNPPLHPNCRCFILPEKISVKSMKIKKAPEEKSDDDVWELLAEIVK